jgi:hypothetical protein
MVPYEVYFGSLEFPKKKTRVFGGTTGCCPNELYDMWVF